MKCVFFPCRKHVIYVHPWTSIVSGPEGFLEFLQKKGYFQKLKNNSYQHNFGTVNGEKLNDAILKSEMSIENKEKKIFEFQPFLGMWDQICINVHNLGMVSCFILIFSSNQEHIMTNTIRDIKAQLMSN